MNFWTLQWWKANEPDNTSQFEMGLELVGNMSVERHCEEQTIGYLLKLLNKGFVDA